MDKIQKENKEEREKNQKEYQDKLEKIQKEYQDKFDKIQKENKEESENIQKNNKIIIDELNKKIKELQDQVYLLVSQIQNKDYNDITNKNQNSEQIINNSNNNQTNKELNINQNINKNGEDINNNSNNNITNKALDNNKNINNDILEKREITNINQIQKNKDIIINSKNETNNNELDIIKKINKEFLIKENNITNISGSKDGKIFILCMEKTYLINNSSYWIIEGYINNIIQLKNENLLASKGMKILLYSKDNYKEPKYAIDLKCYGRQVIELQNTNQLLFLSEESEILLIIIETEIKTEKIYKANNKKISSIRQINDVEIVIIFKNRLVIFFNLEKKKEINNLILESNCNIYIIDNSFIFNDYLYIALLDNMFIIDINEKCIKKKIKLNFTKIFCFNNNFFGLNKKNIYNIIINNNTIESKLLYQANSTIKSLFQIKENLLLFFTEEEKEIKFYYFN